MPEAMLPRVDATLKHWGLGVHPRHWRVPPIDTYPAVVALAQTVPGRLAMFAVFAVLMRMLGGSVWLHFRGGWLALSVAAALVAAAGRHRWHVALLCTIALLARNPTWFDYSAVTVTLLEEDWYTRIRPTYLCLATIAACAPLVAGLLLLARRFREHPLGRRPVLIQHIVWMVLTLLASSHLLHGLPQVLIWSVIACYSAYFWYLAYAFTDQRQREPRPLLSHFAAFQPFFGGGGAVPMGSGAAQWHGVEARDPASLAVTQLKGIKLLAWAFALKVLHWSYMRVVYDHVGVTPLARAFEIFLNEGTVSPAGGFASIVANFPDQLLRIAIWGHVIVAIARFAGFRLLRNTWRPLSARTIAEFWNRYFHYFKEVLVHMYFYPTYLRCFRRHPRLRIAFATFMAAGVGNFFFHLIMENFRFTTHGAATALLQAQTYAFYCVALSGGIILSQLFAKRPDPAAGWWRAQLLPSLGVATFFGFLSFFDGPQRHVDLMTHFDFLFHVFGVR